MQGWVDDDLRFDRSLLTSADTLLQFLYQYQSSELPVTDPPVF